LGQNLKPALVALGALDHVLLAEDGEFDRH
jgi:hypothetical protein